MPRISLGLGISSSSKLPSAPTVPAGIPVASTASLIISENATFNGIAFKKVSGERVLGIQGSSGELYVYSGIAYAYGLSYGQGKILIPPQTVIIDSYEFGYPDKLYTPSNTWRLVAAGYDGEQDSYNIDSIANNPSTNPNYIPTTGWSPSLTIAAAPAAPDIDTNYVQDIFLTNSIREGMNGVWTNVSESFGFPAWVNFLYSSYVYLFAPNSSYSGGESWYFYDSDQGDPYGIGNPSTNKGYLPTTGWTENISISAYTWKYGNNNYLLLGGLVYDDSNSFYQMPANGVSVNRQDPGVYFDNTPYSGGGSFISYSNANGGTFTYIQDVYYDGPAYNQIELATKTNSPSARGLPAYGYTPRTYVTGSLKIEPILYVPISAASINVSGLTFGDQDISGYFYGSQPFAKYSATAWYGGGDDSGNVVYYINDQKWTMAVYSGNNNQIFAYNYASSVSGIPLSGWIFDYSEIPGSFVTGYPRITQA